MIKNDSIFESENLIYRPIEKEDSTKIVEWRNNPQINQFFYDPQIITITQHLKWFEKYQNNPTRYDYMIIIRNSNKKIGIVGLQNIDYDKKSAEVAYMIGETTEQRKGYASEAINAVLQFAYKTFHIKKEIAVIHKNNMASSQMIQHIGFCYERKQDDTFDIYKRETNKIIGIRVDGNAEIGTGHVMRSLAIAEALREKGAMILFITADKTPNIIIRKQRFPVITLDSDWQFLEAEIKSLLATISEYSIEKLIIDTYQIIDHYFEKLKPHCKLYYIDDYGDKRYTLDGVINYNITAELSQYQKLYDGTDTELIIGTKYVPLRKEFQNIKPIKIKKKIKNVLITTGGTDPCEISTQLANMIIETEEFSKIKFHFVCGRFYKNHELLKKLCSKHQNIFFHTNVQEMSELILMSDLAISAGGTTLYELCACGIPTICFNFVNNQDKAVASFGKKDCMLNCNYKNKNFFNSIKEKILYLKNNYDKRCRLNEKVLDVTDGSGVYRIADKIMKG